ncbi:hypothetical protein CPB85DRAFT_1299956 [Mucidula mucida]|nr:hypothetical protein CPB85DRAFT_1299956 [Mucidula mucida]
MTMLVLLFRAFLCIRKRSSVKSRASRASASHHSLRVQKPDVNSSEIREQREKQQTQTKKEICNPQTESKNIAIHQDLERAIENETEFINEVHIAKAVLCITPLPFQLAPFLQGRAYK